MPAAETAVSDSGPRGATLRGVTPHHPIAKPRVQDGVHGRQRNGRGAARARGVPARRPKRFSVVPTEFLRGSAGDKSRASIDDNLARRHHGTGSRARAPKRRGLLVGRVDVRPGQPCGVAAALRSSSSNLAHWMLPAPPPRQRVAAAVSRWACCAMLALVAHADLMLAAAVAVMDVMVWQCMGLDYCGSEVGSAVGDGVGVRARRASGAQRRVLWWYVIVRCCGGSGRRAPASRAVPPNPRDGGRGSLEIATPFWCNRSVGAAGCARCHVMVHGRQGRAHRPGRTGALRRKRPQLHTVGTARLAANGRRPPEQRVPDNHVDIWATRARRRRRRSG
jgi:hypothetical protein